MSSGFLHFFNLTVQRASNRANSAKKARAGRERSPLKPRRLRAESLEERQLLSADGLLASAATYDAASANIISIGSSDLSIDAIKLAIQEAARSTSDDVIEISGGYLDFSSANDEIVIDIDSSSYGALTIISVDGELNIDAQSLARVFTIKNGDVTLESINITNGLADYGGAIANGGTLTLVDVELTGNEATVSGGAIANKGELYVQDSIIRGNVTVGDGAAIFEGDFSWPEIDAPEWSTIPDLVGGKGTTVSVDLSEYSNGDWSYSYSIAESTSVILAADPTLDSNGVLSFTFIGDDDYYAEDDYSALTVTVTASNGTESASTSFSVSLREQTSTTFAAKLSNMSLDDVEDEYAQYVRVGRVDVLMGYADLDGIPDFEVVDLNQDTFVQVWYRDDDIDGLEENVWNAGDYTTIGLQYILHLDNATVSETYGVGSFVRDGYSFRDLGNGDYRFMIAYTAGINYGYGEGLLADVVKITPTDPSQPVSATISQLSTDFTNPTITRFYTGDPVSKDGLRNHLNVDPSQTLFVSSISNSTEPLSSKPGEPITTGLSSAVADADFSAATTSAPTLIISNSLIVENTAGDNGVVYVEDGGSAYLINTTVAENVASGAAIYYNGSSATSVNIGNSIVVNGELAPATSGARVIYSLVNSSAWSSATTYAGGALFANASAGNYALAAGSEALNIGNDELALDVYGESLTVDLSGANRFSSTVDAGAYEYQGSAPTAPTNLTVSDYNASDKQPVLSWTASSDVDGYYVYLIDSSSTLLATLDGAATSYADLATVVSLEDNSSYRFGVAAFNAYGVSSVTTVTLDTLVAPVAPTNLAFTAYANHSSTLSWDAVDNAASYNVEQYVSGEWIVVTRTTNTYYQVSGLSDFSSYTYRVVAVNAVGTAASDSITLDTTVAPSAPTNLAWSASYDGSGSATLIWTAVENATGYSVRQKVDGEWVVLGSASDTVFTFSGLQDNTTYEFSVAAYAETDSDTLYSDYAEISLNTTVAPAAPTDLTWSSEYANGRATLSWSAVENATGYAVARYDNGSWTILRTTTSTSYTITGLSDNAEYVFGVAAYATRDGERLYSDYASIDLNTIVAPTAPTNVRFSDYDGGTSATLTWSAVTNATGYQIEQKTSDGWEVVDTTNATTYTATVEENSFYTYRVSAYTTVGDQTKYSSAVEASLDTLVAPTGELTLTVSDYNADAATATLSWNALETAGYYIVEQQVGSGAWTVLDNAATDTSYALTGLTPNTTYTFRVSAGNAAGVGSQGETTYFTAAAPEAPALSYRYDKDANTATLSYSSEYATSYSVYQLQDSTWTLVYSGAETSYTAEDLVDNQEYSFRVTASNSYGTSSATEVTFTASAEPQAPTGLTIGDYADGAAELSWNAVDYASGYRVYLQTESGWTQVGSDLAANTTSYALSGLEDYSEYVYTVVAFNDEGVSDYATPVTLDTTVAPDAPQNIALVDEYDGSGSTQITWDAVDHAEGYIVALQVEGAWTQVGTATTTTVTIEGLENYQTYVVGVAAYATRGSQTLASDYATYDLSTAFVPTEELTLVVNAYDYTAGTTLLEWNDVAEATGYRVEQQVSSTTWQTVATTTDTEYALTLDPNSAYTYRVVAFNAKGDGSSASSTFFTSAPPAAPSDAAFGAYDAEAKEATLTWSAVEFATGYTLEVYDADSESWGVVSLEEETATSYTVSGMSDYTTYRYRVAAYNEIGSSQWVEASIYTSQAPQAPTDLAIEFFQGSLSANLSWSLSDGATGYYVYQADQDGAWQQIANLSSISNTYTIQNLELNTDYVFGVSAYNSDGESSIASIDLATTTAPATVSDLTVTTENYAGDGLITLSWTESQGAESYQIKLYADGVEGPYTIIGTTTDTTFDVTGLENYKDYVISVTAVNQAGASEEAFVEVSTMLAPSATLTLVASDYDFTTGSLTLSWNEVEYADGYRFEVLGSSGDWVVVAVTDSLGYVLSLEDNTTYNYRVVAFNSIGDGSSDEIEFFTAAPPAAPTDVAFGEYVSATGKATATWSAVPYATSYSIEQLVDGEWTTLVENYDDVSYTVSGLTDNATFTYRIWASNELGDSEKVEFSITTTTSEPPAAPSDFTVSSYDELTHKATMTWTDNATNETGFHVQYSYDQETWIDAAFLDANVTSRVANGLTPGRTYCFRLAAFNDIGYSDWVETSFDTPAEIPSAPSDVAFSEYDADAKEVTMTWVDNSNNELGFKIQCSFDQTEWFSVETVGANVTSRVATGLVEGRTYYFRVASYNLYGVSDWATGQFTVPTSGTTAPAAPSNIVFSDYEATASGVEVTMSWTDNSDDEERFVVQFSYDNENWYGAGTTDADVTSRRATGLVEGRTYYFRVAAYNSAGYSDWATATYVVPYSTINAPSDIVFGEYSNGELPMSWTDNSEDETGFVVQYSYDGENWHGAGRTEANVTSRVATKMTPGRTYYFRVAAYNGSVYSDWATGVYTTPSGAPNAPGEIVFSDYANNTVKMSWTDASNDEIGFNVEYSIDGGDNWYTSGNTSADIAYRTATGLRPNVTYQFRVRSYNAFGRSGWTYGQFTVPAASDAPAAPTDFLFGDYDADARTLAMSWTDNATNETGYKVQYSVDGGETWYAAGNYGANVTSRVATSVSASRTYLFRVAAYNASGASDWLVSDSYEVSSSSNIPSAPTDLVFSDYDAQSNTVVMSWTDTSSNEKGFKVEYSVNDGETWNDSAYLQADATSRVASGLVAGRVYYFRVAAFNNYGYSDWLVDSYSVVSTENIEDPTITGYAYSSKKRQITVAWNDVATSYAAQYRQAETTDWYTLSTSGNSATLNNAIYGLTYEFRVQAISEDNTASNWVYGSYNTATGESTAIFDELFDGDELEESLDSLALNLVDSQSVAKDGVSKDVFRKVFEDLF